ncbi:hypothetical protein [uncultured Tateyamaria sp.]|uniref:hypothetical protein n=1 Tax=uncultured Tateyamaria sp. TaxID=455651 RepID=UPI002607DBC9|nr:hypothetical protein [uncultured Tateyamaria sp.]
MRKFFNSFLRDDSGAVTVDWVVLTAAVVALAVALVLALTNGSVGVSAGVEEFMTNWSF